MLVVYRDEGRGKEGEGKEKQKEWEGREAKGGKWQKKREGRRIITHIGSVITWQP